MKEDDNLNWGKVLLEAHDKVVRRSLQELPSEPITLGNGIDPPDDFIPKWLETKMEVKDIPLCSVCKKETICWLEDTRTGEVLEIMNTCRGCLLGFTKDPVAPTEKIAIEEQDD